MLSIYRKAMREEVGAMNRQAIILVGVVGILVLSCDTNAFRGGKQDAPLPPATTILEVRVEPDTVAVGEITSFTCIIADSLDTGFVYTWTLGAEFGFHRSQTSVNSIEWRAPKRAQTYQHIVYVNDSDGASTVSVSRTFFVTVIP